MSQAGQSDSSASEALDYGSDYSPSRSSQESQRSGQTAPTYARSRSSNGATRLNDTLTTAGLPANRCALTNMVHPGAMHIAHCLPFSTKEPIVSYLNEK